MSDSQTTTYWAGFSSGKLDWISDVNGNPVMAIFDKKRDAKKMFEDVRKVRIVLEDTNVR